MRNESQQLRPVIIGLLAVLLLCGVAVAQGPQSGTRQAFNELEPVTEVVYLLANSSIIIGSDPKGPSDEITFTGTVQIRKFPFPGYERRQTNNDGFQIDFQLLNSELKGESYHLGGTVKLGEDKELPSLGVITQSTPGKDYPADFIVQRKVLIETPAGTLKNVEPVPVRGVIDSIPPFRLVTTPDKLNVFKGEQLPVAMLDQSGKVGGWFYSKMHMAFAVNPAEIYRMTLTGTVSLRGKDGQTETVALQGPAEFLRSVDRDQVELVKLGLRGESKLLGGQIMLTEAFSQNDKFSMGSVGIHGNGSGPQENSFKLYLDLKTPSGTMLVPEPLTIRGVAKSQWQQDTVQMRGHTVPVYALELAKDYEGTGSYAISNEAEQPVGVTLTSIRFRPNPTNRAAVADGGQKLEVAGRRPCCPRVP